ncbi:MAG: hypothetical protein ACLP5V_07740 [Candidatus Bathyarchaeia archaeon]
MDSKWIDRNGKMILIIEPSFLLNLIHTATLSEILKSKRGITSQFQLIRDVRAT